MIALALALGCVLLNAFFVAIEFALAKVRPTSLEALAQGGDRAALRAHRMTQHLDAYLSATQLGITLASLGLGWIGEPAMTALLVPVLLATGLAEGSAEGVAVTLGFAVLSGLHIVVGELVPKSLAILRPEAVSRSCSLPMRAFYVLSFPALWLLNQASRAVLRLMKLPPTEHAEGRLSLEELRLIIRASLGEEGSPKAKMIERMLRASDRPVRAIMVPRVDMEVLSLRDGHDAWLARVRRTGFSRYPVSEDGDPDHVVGYVYVKDLLMAAGNVRSGVAGLLRDVLYVPASQTVGDLLQQLRTARIPFAIVVDEYGGTEGLVTLEDVVASLVGELGDELAEMPHPTRITRRPDGTIVADGNAPAGEIELDGRPLPELSESETISGWVCERLGRIPMPGDVIAIARWEVIVEDVRARRVHRVRFRRSPDGEPEGDGALPQPA